MAEEIYTNKDKQFVLVNPGKLFIYESLVFCRYKGYFGLIDSKHFSCNHEIPNIVETFFRDAHTEMKCSLLAAPLSWLLENDYIKYVKPDKKKIIKIVKTKKNGKSKTTIGKSGSWQPSN